MSLAISRKSWLGVAREATSGTAITTPTLYVPCKSMIKAMQKRVYLDEERASRDTNFDVVPTTRDTEWDVKGPWYNDSMVYYLIAALGSETPSQPNAGTDPTVWKHTLSLADIPPSLTLHKSLVAAAYYAPYAVVEKFKLKLSGAEKLIEFETSGKAIWPTKNGTPPTPSFSTVKPFAGYAPTLTTSAGASSDIIDLEIDFEQKWNLWNPANGQPDFTTAYPGERKVTLSFTARFDNDTLYQLFRTATTDNLTFDCQGAIISHAYAQELQLVLPVVSYDSMEHDLGKENVLIKAKGTSLTQSGGPISGFVQNTVASYTV